MTGKRPFLWLLIPICVVAFLAVSPVRSNDIWQHLASAREIVRSGTIPGHDVFLYPSEGRRWINHSWGAQLALYLVYQTGELAAEGGGPNALIILRVILLASATGIFCAVAVRRSGDYMAAALSALALGSLAAPFSALRPQLFAPILAGLMLLCLERPSPRRMFLAVVLQLLWANMHPSFLLGPFIVGCMALHSRLAPRFRVIDERPDWRPLLMLVPALLLVSLLNPNHYETFLYGVRLQQLEWTRKLLGEWQPPEFSNSSTIYLMTGVAAVWIVVIWASIRRKCIDLADVILLVTMTFMYFRAVRFAWFWCFFSIPIAGRALGDIIPSEKRLRVLTGVALWILCATVPVLRITYVYKYLGVGFGVEDTDRTPVKAVSFLVSSGIKGNVFCPIEAGGYIEWVYPAVRPSLDVRCLVNEPETIRKYLALEYNRPEWKDAFPSPGVSDVMLIMHTAFATPVYQMKETWAVVYWDDQWEILTRRGGSYDHLILTEDLTHTAPNILPFTYPSLGPQEKQAVDAYLMKRITTDPGCGSAHALMAYTRYLAAIELIRDAHEAAGQIRATGNDADTAEARYDALMKDSRKLLEESNLLFQRDRELTTGESRSLYGIARNMIWLNRSEESKQFFKSASAIDPLNWLHAKNTVEYYTDYLSAIGASGERVEETNRLLLWVIDSARAHRGSIVARYRKMERENEIPQWLTPSGTPTGR